MAIQDQYADKRGQLKLELERLSNGIEQFRVECARFFGGDLKVPPENLKDRLVVDIRRLRALASKGGTASSFRLSSLEARFNSQLDLYNRRLREQEIGPRRKAETAPQADPARDGVVVGKKGADNAVETLYKGLYLRGNQRSPSMDLEKFRSYIDRQTQAIQQKTGASNVQFRIAIEDGKMKLKARPLKG